MNSTKEANHITEGATGFQSWDGRDCAYPTAAWVFHCSFKEQWQKESHSWKSDMVLFSNETKIKLFFAISNKRYIWHKMENTISLLWSLVVTASYYEIILYNTSWMSCSCMVTWMQQEDNRELRPKLYRSGFKSTIKYSCFEKTTVFVSELEKSSSLTLCNLTRV